MFLENPKNRLVSPIFANEINERILKLKEMTESNGIEFPENLLSAVKDFSDSTTQISVIQHDEDESYYTSVRLKHELGIPPPSDLEKTVKKSTGFLNLNQTFNSSFASSSSESEIEPKSIKKKSKFLKRGLKKQLRSFKETQHKYIESMIRSETENSAYRDDMLNLHRSATEILDETVRTKQEIQVMRKKFNQKLEVLETPRKVYVNYNEEEGSNMAYLFEKIEDLKAEVMNINSRISVSKEELESKENEQQELIEIIQKVRDSLIKPCVLDSEEQKETCKCMLF